MIQIGINIAVKGSETSGTSSPPINIGPPVISGTTTLGSVLTLTYFGGWLNAPIIGYTFQWKRGGINIGTGGSTYTLVVADSGAAITCEVTATNTAGSSAPAASNIITADNYAPVNSSPPVISGTTTVGSVLTTTDGTWTNSPSSFSYQWKRGATNIGTNANTYTLVQADAAQDITCVVTATNTAGSANATSNILYIYDLDAQNFITTAAISNSTEKIAINNLVIGLKSDSLWTSMLAIYPFVGNTSTQQQYNLKNPATFTLSFQGGWTHSSNGALPNGTTGYANTNFTPSTSGWALGNSSISAYSRTNNVMGSGVIYGVRSGATSNNYPVLNVSSTSNFHNSGVPISPSPLPTSTACNFISSRINTANVIMAINGTATSYVNAENTLASVPIYLGARRNAGATDLYSTRQLAFAHIGTGLTTGQCTSLYTRIQAFQTTLGRANP
jgi:hypothetical protein